MDSRGGCCIARYAGGAHDTSKVDQIMLRFRPIAPKPVATGGGSLSPVSGGSPPWERSSVKGRCRKGKRRSPNDCSRTVKRKRRVASSSSQDEKEDTTPVVVTLPLLPETPVGKSSPDLKKAAEKKVGRMSLPTWMTSFNNQGKSDDTNNNGESNHQGRSSDRTVVMAPQPVRVTGSRVTVECVTDTWTGDVVGFFTLGSTDEEMRRNLERDTCPGFVSDAWNRVTWTNAAYRRMVAAGVDDQNENGGAESGMGVVWVVMKESVPWTHAGFTCRVRVQYTWGKERRRQRSSITLPCDVWRMYGGGFAWRLDVDAALSLGR